MSVAIAIAVDPITEAQRRLPPRNWYEPRTRREYRVLARWLELEASRGYDSADRTRREAAAMRWAAAMAGLYGDRPWRELARMGGARWDGREANGRWVLPDEVKP